MKIRCKRCDSEIGIQNINIASMAAKCDNCGNVFSFADRMPGQSLPFNIYPGSGPVARDGLQLPKRVSLGVGGDGFDLRMKWFRPLFFFLLFFCVVWDGILGFAAYMIITEGEPVFLAALALHGAVGIGLTYWTLAGFLNTTKVSINMGVLKVGIGPLPMPKGNRILESARIKQLYTKEIISRGRNGVSRTYEVRVMTTGGEDLRLIKGVADAEQALFIEQEVERYLGIHDTAVAGEIPRP